MSMSDKSFPHDAVYKKFFSHPEMVESLLLEFQSSPAPRMPIRLLVYTGQLLLRLMDEDKSLRPGHLPAVLPIVLYNGEAPWSAHRNTIDVFDCAARAQCGAYLPNLRYILVDERRLDASRADIRDGLMALVARFGQAGTEEEVLELLSDMERVLEESENRELYRVFLEWARQMFLRSGVPGNWEEQVNTFGEVRTMFNVEQWKENWLAQGMARGMAQGMAQGMEQGRDEEKRHGAVRMLALGKLTHEEIAQVFDLSLDEVRALAHGSGIGH